MRGIVKFVVTLGLTAALFGTADAKTLRIGLAEDPDILDPTLARTFVGRIVFASLCDKLFEITPDLKIVPQLATGYEWSADNKTLTIKLRQGVVFHDGEQFDAQAAKFSLERHLNMQGSNRKAEISAVQSVDAVDDNTIRLNLSKPFAPLLAALTDRAGMMVSPKAAQAEAGNFGAAPVCAGPYKFVERVAQDHITLAKFDNYWNKDAFHVDQVEFRTIIDNPARLANLESGSLDMIERLPPTDVPTVRKDSKLQIASITELGYQSIEFNTNNGPMAQSPIGQDPRLREAFELAIDRDALNQVVFNGEFTPGNQWVAPGNPYYAKDFPVPKRDVEKAKALLKAAGHPNLEVTMMTPTTQEPQAVAQVIQAMVKEAGIDLKIQSVEFATSLDRAEKGDFEAYLIGWSGRSDPDGNIYNFVACKAPLNDGHYCNPELDKVLDESRASSDPAARAKVYEKVAAIVLNERPWIFLYHRKWIWGLTKNVDGYTPYPDGLIRLAGVNLK
ncbi:MAG TPA: ABC transporter substrate-binding protein [Alphaproteobacteria bacterium]|nr:ABC transporter substrate-binding protein [Alphaproteobacteria bacterium]